MIDFLYESIERRIKQKLPWINSVAMYEQQDILQAKSLGFKPPVIFIEFGTPIYTTLGNYVQQGDVSITIKYVFEEYTKNYLKGIKKKSQIVQALSWWSDWQFAMVRTDDDTDENADSLYVCNITFKTSFYEDLSADDLIPLGGTNGYYGISVELLITNDGVNYSDHSGTSGTNFIPLEALS